MKSVIAQGATVSKAIEEALTKAGMPKEFFVKLLEEGRSGFLGFGATKAKIALFYKEVKVEQPEHTVLSQSSYKNLFDNKNLQAQIDQQERVEKGETKPVLQRPTHKERQPRRGGQRMHHRRPRKQQSNDQQSTDQQLTDQRSTDQLMDQQSKSQRSVGQRLVGQRPRNQRPVGQRQAGQRPTGQRPVDQQSRSEQSEVQRSADLQSSGHKRPRHQQNQATGEQKPKKEIKVRQLEPKKKQQDSQQELGQKKQLQRRPRRKSSWGNDRKRSDKVHNGNDSDKE